MHARYVVAVSIFLLLLSGSTAAQTLSPEEYQKYIEAINKAAAERPKPKLNPAPPPVSRPLAPGPDSRSAYSAAIEYSGDCPILPRALARNARGADVSALQKFLISRGYLEEDAATGFFGALTEAAVREFQEAEGIVSSGTAETSGFGAAGPRTREAIATACEEGGEVLEEVDEGVDQSEENFDEELLDEEEFFEEGDEYPSCETSVSPETITAGDEATLQWTTTNATSAAWVGIGKVDLSGSLVVRPNEFAEYVLKIIGMNGEQEECVQYIDVYEVPEPFLEISATPEDVEKGGSSTITWSATDVAHCELVGKGVAVSEVEGSVDTPPLTSDTTYTLTCKSVLGERSEEVTIYIIDEDLYGTGVFRLIANALTAIEAALADFLENLSR